MSNGLAPDSLFVDIHYDENRWLVAFPELEERIKEAFRNTVGAVAPRLTSSQVCVVLSQDATVQALNNTYRHKNQPTNVLSFPAAQDMGVDLPIKPLGDIILAFETIQRESQEQNKTFADHTLHLAVHGALHLFGYDHVHPDEAEAMESLEIEILTRTGVQNPYEINDAKPVN